MFKLIQIVSEDIEKVTCTMNRKTNYDLYFIFKGPVTLGYGLIRSHAEGAKATHRESASVSVGKRP